MMPVNHDPTPYQRDGKWFVMRKIDSATLVEKPATDKEVAKAIEDARAKLAALEGDKPTKKAKE